MGTNGVYLYLLKASPCVGYKTPKIQHQARIVRAYRKRNLLPAIVGLTPVGCRPSLIQRLQRAITLLEKGMKLASCLLRVVGMAVLIVYLPTDHPLILAETLGHLLYNKPTVLNKHRAVRRAMTAVAVLHWAPVGQNG